MALEQPVLRPSFLWIGDLQDLTIFTIGSNNFTGTLPTELEQLVKLTDLIHSQFQPVYRLLAD
jgi:hypothetical protein